MKAAGGNQVFATVLRYLAARWAEPASEPADLFDDGDDGEQEDAIAAETPAGLERVPEALIEIAESFESSGGFAFEPEEALVLSHLFTVVEAGMRTLADQAADQGQANAAAKIEWSADQAREMMGYLMEKHASGDGGTLVLIVGDEDEA